MHRRRQMLDTRPAAMWYPVLEGECDMRVPQVTRAVSRQVSALRGLAGSNSGEQFTTPPASGRSSAAPPRKSPG
jgi:hypothetical protein